MQSTVRDSYSYAEFQVSPTQRIQTESALLFGTLAVEVHQSIQIITPVAVWHRDG